MEDNLGQHNIEKSLEFLKETKGGKDMEKTPMPDMKKLNFEEYLKSLELELLEYINKTNMPHDEKEWAKEAVLAGHFESVADMLKEYSKDDEEVGVLLEKIKDKKFQEGLKNF